MKKSKLITIIGAIKKFFSKTNGVLLINNHSMSFEVKSYYIEVTSDLEMLKISEDKKNMRGDAAKLKGDIKKAVAAYNSEFCNG